MLQAEAEAKARVRPVVTFSRETAAGAHSIALRLAELLEARSKEKWGVLDRELVMEVIKTHNLPARVAEYMPEAPRREVTGWVEELLGVHPPVWTLVEKTNDTIRRLANAGNVILVGRGAHSVTSRTSTAFHVRLVAPLEKRVERATSTYEVSIQEARRLVEQKDRERRHYVKQNFDRDVGDALDYHLVLNTGLLSDEEAAQLIAEAVSRHVSLAVEP